MASWLVHPNGVVLFDDWHPTPLDQSTIETEVDHVGARLAQTGTEAKALLERMDRHIKHRR